MPDAADAASVDVFVADAGIADGASVPDGQTQGDAVIRPPSPNAEAGLPPADALPDAGPADGTSDAAAADACVGFSIPQLPASQDGEELCNYQDDDGDGLVDEGLQYGFLGPPVALTSGPQWALDELHAAWSGDGWGVAWAGNEPGAVRQVVNFVKLDEQGCPTSARVTFTANPGSSVYPGGMNIVFAGDRFAVVFSMDRPGNGGHVAPATFLQLIDRDGSLHGGIIDVDPALVDDAVPLVATAGNRFAVFTPAFDPQTGAPSTSAFVILDQEGNTVVGPVQTYSWDDAQDVAVSNVIGMAYDGQGFGMAWEAGSFALGDRIFFMRWSENGDVLVPPTFVDFGESPWWPGEIAWTGSHFAVSYWTGNFIGKLAFVSREDGVLAFEPVRPDNSGGFAQVGWTGVALLGLDGGGVLRMSPVGEGTAPRTQAPPQVGVGWQSFSAQAAGPSLALFKVRTPTTDRDFTFLPMVGVFGCR